MTERPAEMQDDRKVELLNPAMAAFLAWLMPGLGHLYQRRAAKAILFFVCIVGTFAYGVYLGGNETFGYGRVVYACWEKGERRLPYFCQVWVGLPAMPALIEANRAGGGRQPLFGGFMCPPARGHAPGGPPRYSLGTLKKNIPGFELGTTFTMIAGLLNVLAIYDAWDGPVSYEANRKEEDDDEEEEEDDELENDV